MQIVMAWVVGSPLLAVLVGKMISMGDRMPVAVPAGVAGPQAEADPRFDATASRRGVATETAA